MQQRVWMPLHLPFQDRWHVLVEILSIFNGLTEVEQGATGDERLFVRISDLDVDDVYWPVELAAAVKQICAVSHLAREPTHRRPQRRNTSLHT